MPDLTPQPDLLDVLDPHMRDIVIIRPGYDTLRFGPMRVTQAESWLTRLKWSRQSTAMPKGTHWESVPHDPDQPHTELSQIPTTTPELADAIIKDPAFGEAAFPDLYLQLQCVVGDREAYALWGRALRHVDFLEQQEEEEVVPPPPAPAPKGNPVRTHVIRLECADDAVCVAMDLTSEELAVLMTLAEKVEAVRSVYAPRVIID